MKLKAFPFVIDIPVNIQRRKVSAERSRLKDWFAGR